MLIPFAFPPFPPSPPFCPPSPAAKRLPENHLGVWGSSVSFPSGVLGEAPAAFVVYFELENRTWRQHFFLQTS